MDAMHGERGGTGALGIVFFANDFIRALDAFRESKRRTDALSELCDRAIASLHALHHPDDGDEGSSSGLLASPDELVALASSFTRVFHPKSAEDASKGIERIQKTISRVKSQKEFTEDLRERIEEVVAFFESVAEEGLANCRRQASGDVTEAERVWQHYATT